MSGEGRLAEQQSHGLNEHMTVRAVLMCRVKGQGAFTARCKPRKFTLPAAFDKDFKKKDPESFFFSTSPSYKVNGDGTQVREVKNPGST